MFPTLIHLGPYHFAFHPGRFSIDKIGPFYIATYGFLVAMGYLVAILWLKSQMKFMNLKRTLYFCKKCGYRLQYKSGQKAGTIPHQCKECGTVVDAQVEPKVEEEERFWMLIYSLFFGAICGGKLLYVILNWHAFATGQMSFIRDFRFGFVFFGGFLGACLMGLLFFRGRLIDFARVSDYFGAIAPVGHAIGRLGCLSAGCCWGKPTTMPWAIRFTNGDSLIPTRLLDVPIHPTQLYEAAGNLVIAGFLFPLLNKVKKGQLPSGSVFCAYAFLYAILRFIVEFYRGDDRGGFWLGLSPSQWISLVVAATALIAARRLSLWQKKFA